MDNLLLYLPKASAGLALLYLCYILLYSKDTFYTRNRIMLIMILLVSSIIPVIKIFSHPSGVDALKSAVSLSYLVLSETQIEESVSGKISSFNLVNILVPLYFAVAGFILLRLVISVLKTRSIIRKGEVLDGSFPKVIFSDTNHGPFSFFPYVVIPKRTHENEDFNDILEHEKAHVRQGHTFDLLLAEISTAFFWFNPFMWLIKRSIVLNHEYLADNYSLKKSSNIREYQYRLLKIPENIIGIPFAHNFSSLIKNRIAMINKKPTQNYASLKNIVILPAIALLLIMFSFKPDPGSAGIAGQETLFSEASKGAIFKFLATNIMYPEVAKNSCDTGKVFVVLKIDKGGIIRECKVATDETKINVPVFDEIVVTGSMGSKVKSVGEKTADHSVLKDECIRVANRLNEVDIPEWKEKNMEFALAFKFMLK